MTKVEFVRAWHEKVQTDTGMVFTNRNATVMYENFVNLMVSELKTHGKLSVSGLGIFKIKKRPPRKGRNPKTGETVNIPARKTIVFKMTEQLKQELN